MSPDAREPEGEGTARGAAGVGDPGSAPDPELERLRRLRRISRFLQAGGIAFLAVVSLGLLPTILSATYPGAGERAAVAVWILAPAIPIALLVVAAFRLPR